MDRGCVFLLQADVVLSKAIAVPQVIGSAINIFRTFLACVPHLGQISTAGAS